MNEAAAFVIETAIWAGKLALFLGVPYSVGYVVQKFVKRPIPVELVWLSVASCVAAIWLLVNGPKFDVLEAVLNLSFLTVFCSLVVLRGMKDSRPQAQLALRADGQER